MTEMTEQSRHEIDVKLCKYSRREQECNCKVIGYVERTRGTNVKQCIYCPICGIKLKK